MVLNCKFAKTLNNPIFKAPKCEKLRQKWEQILSKKGITKVRNEFYICGRHFEEKNIFWAENFQHNNGNVADMKSWNSTCKSFSATQIRQSSEEKEKEQEKHEHEKENSVTVNYIQGLPHLTVPLPSRNEKCRFALKPVSHNVGDLIQMLKTEDRGIDRAAILNSDGIRIASTCSIENLMDEPFLLHINDKHYTVVPPKRDRISSEDISKLSDVRALVSQLYEALHVGEYHIKKEKELVERLEELQYQITPLEERKSELSNLAVRRTNIMTWVGLGLMSVQFGILARLTWWEYSWDIMEPVTYFVTYGTAMAAYAYFCITKEEYNFSEVRDRQYLITIHKRAKKNSFDVESYNILKRQMAEVEYDLKRLRDPLNLQLPPHLEHSFRGSAAVMKPGSKLRSQSDSNNLIDISNNKTVFQKPTSRPKKS